MRLRRSRHAPNPNPVYRPAWTAKTVAGIVGCLALLSSFSTGPAFAEAPPPNDIARARERLRVDIEHARRELTEARAAAEQDRGRRHAELRSVEADIDMLRTDIEALDARRRAMEVRTGGLTDQVLALERTVAASRAAHADLARRILERLNPAMSALDSRQQALAVRAEHDLTGEATRRTNHPTALFLALDDTMRSAADGRRGEGTVLDLNGIAVAGRWLRVGPCAWFAAADGTSAGLLLADADGMPALWPRKGAEAEAIMTAIAGAPAHPLPVDVTRGDALHLTRGQPGWREQWRQGGAVMIPLAMVGVAALLVSLWRAGDLLRLRLPRADEVAALAWTAGEDEARAARSAAACRWPAGPMLAQALRHRRDSTERLEQVLHEQILGEVPRLEKHLALLAVLAGVAPLLGLLGTVTGMIHTFQLVTLFGAGDVRVLSGGISEALLTTKTGLAIAIPALLAHAVLRRMARGLILRLENLAIVFVETNDTVHGRMP